MSSHDRPKTPKGSVKAARERAEAGIPRKGGPPSHAPISRPIQMPQWPLNSNGSNGSSANISPATLSPPHSRKETPPTGSPVAVSPTASTPPHRPNRPSDVPSMLDGSKIQDPVPAFQSTVTSESDGERTPRKPDDVDTPTWNQGNVLLSPGEPSTPGAGLSGTSNSSRPSTTSSFGSIPDFPVPDIPPQAHTQGPPRRSLGPPPTSRRGVSSYYSHNSHVAPIPEEHPDGRHRPSDGKHRPSDVRQHNSYASSSAVPKSWVDGPPEYYMTSYREEEEEDEEDDVRDSRSTEPDDTTGLVRKASLGRQFKPSLTTVRSNSSSGSDNSKNKKVAAGTVGTAGAIAAAAAGGIGMAESMDLGEMLPAKAYGDSKQNSMRATPQLSPKAGRSGSATPKSIPADPRVRQILGGLEKGGAIGDVDELPPSAIRRPPRLDMGAVRETESRGSMTSLPDLIKRATKLASNLDKGRTASRLGMLEFNASDPNLLNKLNEHRERQLRAQRDSTISGILSSFPAPALTPTGDQTWNGPYDQYGRDLMTPMSPLKPDADERARRRCCGMPLWLFLLVILLLLVVIAAAIVLPVVLVVIPQNNASSSAQSDLSQCPTSTQCQNGGKPVVASNACRCVCAGGFTGSTCTTANDGACTDANVGSYKGATLGNSVPRIFSTAPQFQINLNATAILSTFANSDISCASENALMAINGQTQKREAAGWAAVEAAVGRRALQARVPQAVTSNGVVLATMGTSALPTAATVSGTAVPSAAPTGSPNAPSGSDEDFARVAILYALGSSFDLNTALNVQQALMSKLQDGSFKTTPVNAGAGVTVDFQKHVITVNGTKA
jgi:hypothetical protein